MPRPKNGYQNAAGEQVPATHDPISRYMDRSALMYWAHGRGVKGLPLYDSVVLDIGSLVHAMADLDLRGRPDREIEKLAQDAGLPRDDYDKAMRAFMQFRKWRVTCRVEPMSLEVPLVSETYQYGGTPDCIARIDGKICLVEFKTSAKPYPDHLVAMAAHAQLWNENRPGFAIEAYHWIGLPKDGSEFQHHAYADLSTQWQIFTLWLDAWRLEKGVTRKRTTKAPTVMPAPKARLTVVASNPEPDPSKPRGGTRKPKEALPAEAITPSQAGAVLRAVPRKRRRNMACSNQYVLPGILPLPSQITMTEILRQIEEAA